MSAISLKDYKISNLQNEYNSLSNILYNTEKHIERLYTDGVFSLYNRNVYFKTLNDILRNMNTRYNKYMTDTCGTDSETEDFSEYFTGLDEIKESNFKDINFVTKMSKLLKINESKLNDDEPLVATKKEIMKLSGKIGFSNIDEALTVLVSEFYSKLYNVDTAEAIEFYNKIFIPVKSQVRKIPSSVSENRDIYLSYHEPISETLLSSSMDIKIKKIDDPENYICLSGYLNYDGLNIIMKTSQICSNFIFQKKKEIEGYLDTAVEISVKFKKNYLKNAPLRDILVYSKIEFLEKLIEDYNYYKKLSKLTFLNLVKEFVKEDTELESIDNMYTVLRLLLLGSEDNINIAGLLFGLTKDKKLGQETISNILYNNLNYSMQVKLKKTNASIKAELERINSLSIDEVDLKKQIALCKYMPSNVKKCAVEKLEEMKASNNEYYKQLLYVKSLLNFPWPGEDDDNYFLDLGKNNKKSKEFLDNIVCKLDDKVYGHKPAKDMIKELMGRWLKNPKSSGSSIGLVGPPGVGKTLIAKAIGEALNIPFVQITLGGQNDGDILHGHGYTYSGAQPGMVVKKMIEAGSSRCIMFFDELDKAAKKHNTNEIFNILIHMTDPNTNNEFQDRFFQEINFPLNKVIFIFSYNDSELIDPVLLDRLTEIDTRAYSVKDKITIAQNFLVKEVANTVGMPNKFTSFTDEDIKYIIEEYTSEAGVRELKRKLEKIFLKMNIDIIYENSPFDKSSSKNNFKMNREIIVKYLDKSGRKIKTVHNKDMVGVINGLYATESGSGGITPIQIYNNYTGSDKKFILKLTGRQGDVMKESVMSGLTTAMHCLKEEIREEFMRKHPYGMHIHTPSGAVPKDGPSAGCAFTTAFVSRILDLKIKRTVAMTGEIEPTGKVTKIGGLLYKLNGAKKAGVKLVLVSKENEEDVVEIKRENPELIDKNFKVKLVSNVTEIFKEALIGFDKKVLI